MANRVRDITSIMEDHFPLYLAEEWDNSGLQTGDFMQSVQRVGLALDPSLQIIEQAKQAQVQLLITHHPLFFKPLKRIDYAFPTGRQVKELIQSGITLYSAHTNLDIADPGLNTYLAQKLGLQHIRPLPSSRRESLIKLAVYVPAAHELKVRQAINRAGAGHIGAYKDCSFRVQGTGTFRPLEGTRPFIGQLNELQEVDEFRLETILPESMIPAVISAVIEAHPYEEPAYDLYPLTNKGKYLTPGRSGILAEPASLEDLARTVKNRLGLDAVKVVGSLKSLVNRVAVVSGSGASFIPDIQNQGIDVLITGDLKYHEACAARDAGLSVIDAGHQGTEEIVVEFLNSLLQTESRARGLVFELINLYEKKCLQNI